MRDQSQHQVRSSEPRGIDSQSQHRPTGQGRITHLSVRPESWQKNGWPTEWLSTSIVHDLRNPLATVYTAAEMLVDLDPGPPQMKRLATNIYRAAGRMQELLADLASATYGNRSTPELCDIGEIIVAASEAASAATENQRVQILLDVPGGIELPLPRSRVKLMFFNLITNALEAMPGGGEIRIGARRGRDYLLVAIEDTGPGIPHEIRDKVFEPFVTAGKENGLGLGLAISRQAVLDHGGDMWIEPAPGARFVIRLPLNHTDCALRQAASSENVSTAIQRGARLLPSLDLIRQPEKMSSLPRSHRYQRSLHVSSSKSHQACHPVENFE
jgi:nitrogen-specific signal transduction histidine kinase